MLNMLWLVLLAASIGPHLVCGYPVISSPQSYPHDGRSTSFVSDWSSPGWFAAIPALALAITAVGFIFGCAWCYRHKDCKPNGGADNQLFVASVTHIHDVRRSNPPDSGFSEPINNNINEDNNNGPISLREMQNIANNNAAAYIVSENEERNRVSRESVVEFEPLPADIGLVVADPLAGCADWFRDEDIQRNKLQYLREISRGWFGRVVEGEIEENDHTTTVAVKILNQNASLEDKAQFLNEAKQYRDLKHENILAYITKYLQEDPWLLIFELCTLDLQQYLETNRSKMAALNESGVPLRLLCDISSAMAYFHSRGYIYKNLWCGNVLVRGTAADVRAVLGQYCETEPPTVTRAPELRRPHATHTASSDVWSLGGVVWETGAWRRLDATEVHSPEDLLCPYNNHLYQVMQLCWNQNPEARPTAAQVHALVNHLYTTHCHANKTTRDDEGERNDFEDRWQRLKPNSIPIIDEHVAIVHAPSTSMASHFTGSDQEFDNMPTIVQDSLSIDMDTAVSRSSSIMSDKDPLSVQIKSESLTNLHGSLDDVRNIYLTHNETPLMECHQANIAIEDSRDTGHDRSDSSVDPWLRDIIAGSHDDVSYYKDVSDVIKNLDNILNSEKTSSSESSHQASPSRDNLILECKKDHQTQSNLVKSPGISNFQNALEMGFDAKCEETQSCDADYVDRDTIGTLSHSFERYSDTTSQHTLENFTPDSPTKGVNITNTLDSDNADIPNFDAEHVKSCSEVNKLDEVKLPKEIKIDVVENNISEVPHLGQLCLATISSISFNSNNYINKSCEQMNIRKDCTTSCDSNLQNIVITAREESEIKSIHEGDGLCEEPLQYVGNVKAKISEKCKTGNESLVEQGVVEDKLCYFPPVNAVVNNSRTDMVIHELDSVIDPDHEKEVKLSEIETKTHCDLMLPLEDTSIKNVCESEEAFSKLRITDLITCTESDERKTNLENGIRRSVLPSETPEQVQTINNEEKSHYSKSSSPILEYVDIDYSSFLGPNQTNREQEVNSNTETEANEMCESEHIVAGTSYIIESQVKLDNKLVVSKNSSPETSAIVQTVFDKQRKFHSDRSNASLTQNYVDVDYLMLPDPEESVNEEGRNSIIPLDLCKKMMVTGDSQVSKLNIANKVPLAKNKDSTNADHVKENEIVIGNEIFLTTDKGAALAINISDSDIKTENRIPVGSGIKGNEVKLENDILVVSYKGTDDASDRKESGVNIEHQSETCEGIADARFMIESDLKKNKEVPIATFEETAAVNHMTENYIERKDEIPVATYRSSVVAKDMNGSDSEIEKKALPTAISNNMTENDVEIEKETPPSIYETTAVEGDMKESAVKKENVIPVTTYRSSFVAKDFNNSDSKIEKEVPPAMYVATSVGSNIKENGVEKEATPAMYERTSVESDTKKSDVRVENEIPLSTYENSAVQSHITESEFPIKNEILSTMCQPLCTTSDIKDSAVNMEHKNALCISSSLELPEAIQSVTDDELQHKRDISNSSPILTYVDIDYMMYLKPVESTNEQEMNRVIPIHFCKDMLVKNDDVKKCSVKTENEISLVHSENKVENEMTQLILPAETLECVETKKAKHLPQEVVSPLLCEQEATPEIRDTYDELVVNNENDDEANGKKRSDENPKTSEEISQDSTVYMYLDDDSKNIITDNYLSDIDTILETSNAVSSNLLLKNESTIYLDLPNVIKHTHEFLQSERENNEIVVNFERTNASTPKSSDGSTKNKFNDPVELVNDKLGNLGKDQCIQRPSAADCGLVLNKLEQNSSPLESPTKSHYTDTYDENSSVVLGPFENSTLDLFKGIKSTDELMGFSANFSDIDIETPSPLRDGNFLNEVPDIIHDDIQFNDVETNAFKENEEHTEDSDSGEKSTTEKYISPSTPPNSPGIFLASTSQQKYLVDIELNSVESIAITSSVPMNIQNEMEINQIDLTTKLAMAENENNMNIEYACPSLLEIQEDSFLAGNGGAVGFALDEDSMRALRNELELKLPLAQVASIEPDAAYSSSDGSWRDTMPLPPELVVAYPPALSPIAEETGHQLNAYENDLNWNASTRTDSSESYPEPCNLSTDEATDLPTAAQSDHSTYTLHSDRNSVNETYTVHVDKNDATTSKEISISADSLNASPRKVMEKSLLNDQTCSKLEDDEKESNCERLSRVSPFLVSPTTETSVPENSDNVDNVTGVSTLSKTTQPTDAKLSKPSETQCVSKATSIDSWCSNDTLYNVEENFDDLALELDVQEYETKRDDDSESTHTLTHNDDEKELSNCSTYLVHDSKTEMCETIAPNSVTTNACSTHTNTKTDLFAITKSTDRTLISGLPTHSNCATELVSEYEGVWKWLPQPEMVRRSPTSNKVVLTPPKFPDDNTNKENKSNNRPLTTEPRIKKMDSIEISCLQDNLLDSITQPNEAKEESPLSHYKHMANSITSTPLNVVIEDDGIDAIQVNLSQDKHDSIEEDNITGSISNFETFLYSAELRPQELSPFASDYVNKGTSENSNLLEKESCIKDSTSLTDRTPNYSDFESSALTKPQDAHSPDAPGQLSNSEHFSKFEDSIKSKPQGLSPLYEATSLLLKNERIDGDVALSLPSQIFNSKTSFETSPSSLTNKAVFRTNVQDLNNIINLDEEDELDQPHSIIITESPKPNITYDSHTSSMYLSKKESETNHQSRSDEDSSTSDESRTVSPKVNGIQYPEGSVEQKENSDLLKDNNTVQNLPKSSSELRYDIKCSENGERFATVNFLNEAFEELLESNVDDGEKDGKTLDEEQSQPLSESNMTKIPSVDSCIESDTIESPKEDISNAELLDRGPEEDKQISTATEDFLLHEKKFCEYDKYLPLLTDIRFTGPTSEIMSTSFNEESPTEPSAPDVGKPEAKPNSATDILKEWDSDTESHSSSGEFIWKDGDGHETSVVPSTHFEHQRDGGETGPQGRVDSAGSGRVDDAGSGDSGSGSGSGSEGDEVEFVPSSWDCRAEPAKSSLRSLEQTTPDSKKRVVFKRQKYHCVYEYPREVADLDADLRTSYLPDFSTYSEWDPGSAVDAELGYGQLFGAPSPLDFYPLQPGFSFTPDYDEDFFITPSARPFESLALMSSSQFFPGMHIKPTLQEREITDAVTEEFPAPPSPLPTPTLSQIQAPSLDFTTPDSGVEDITPGSTTDEEFKAKKLPDNDYWRPVDSGSSSESVSPSSPGGETLGGLRHTRDKLKLDLPPSPHIPSPRHNRVFNFVLDKPKRSRQSHEDTPQPVGTTPLIMTDDTPVIVTTLPIHSKECEDVVSIPDPTFSTFGKCVSKVESEQKIVLTDEAQSEVKTDTDTDHVKVVETVKGEGTVLDSGDEDSGIESSSKATLERNKSTPNL